MPAGRLHADEVAIGVPLVRRLLVAQCPQWADLAIAPVRSAGTDHILFRLGDGMVLRFPRIPAASEQVEKEQRWLPRLAPLLPLAVPIPLARGMPGEGYPWSWSVYRWLDGETAIVAPVSDRGRMALDLARFVAALQRVDPAGGPLPGGHNAWRGVPLADRDTATRAALTRLPTRLDAGAVGTAWEAATGVPAWESSPVWVHGDLNAGNLLIRQGRLSGVIDFGCLCVGDPACDLMVAWTLLSADTRNLFRGELGVDDATWARARGWALSFGVIALPYYQNTNPVLAGIAEYAIAQALTDR